MNNKKIIQYLNQANQSDKIEIRIFNKPIELIKRHIAYEMQDKTLIIEDRYNNEGYLLNIGSIKSIKIIAPKTKGLRWFDGETFAKCEV